MTTTTLLQGLRDMMTDGGVGTPEAADLCDSLNEAQTFEDAMLMTSNEGLVLRMADGSEFQLSVVQSR